MLIGASASRLARAERNLGKLSCGRGPFYEGLPAAFDPNGPRTRPGLPMFVSFTQLDDNTPGYARSCPPATRMIWKHEAENGKAKDGPTFVDEYTRARAVVKSANPAIEFGVASASWAYRPDYDSATTGPVSDGSWLPDPSIVDFYSVDTYQDDKAYANPLSRHPPVQRWYELVKNRGVPLGVTEYAINALPRFGATSAVQDAARAAVIPVDYAWLKRNCFKFWMYWYDTHDFGDPTPTREFIDRASRDAWKSVAADNEAVCKSCTPSPS